MDLVLGDQLGGQVVAGVGDDRDGHDRGTLAAPASLPETASRRGTTLGHLRYAPRTAADMPRTLVTGATGFIGSHVTRLLVERGDEVRVTVRPGVASGALEGLDRSSTVRADVCDRRSIRRAMRGVDRVFHVAGTTSLALPRERAFAVNVEGTRIVLEEALRADVERVVYTSSVAAIGPAPPGRTADESNVWDAGRYGIAYVDSKHEAEVTAMRLVGAAGCRW